MDSGLRLIITKNSDLLQSIHVNSADRCGILDHFRDRIEAQHET